MLDKNKLEQHAGEISDKYVHRINSEHNDVMEEISQLPIQDIITILSNAKWVMDKGLRNDINPEAFQNGNPVAVDYVNALISLKYIIVKRLLSADALWYVTDNITGHPFIDDENKVWIFTEQEYADACVDYFMQQYRTTFQVSEVVKEDIVNFFGANAYLRGAQTFHVDMGAYAGIALKPEDLVPAPDFTDVPEIQRPVMNPDFARSVAKFQQERLYRFNYQGNAEKLKIFEDDMIKSFYHAKFLVPMKILEGGQTSTPDENGECILQAETKFCIPNLTSADKNPSKNATPVFTDWEEFNKSFSQDEWSGWIWRAEDLLSAPEDPIVLNVGSLAFPMSKKMIQQMLDIYKKEFAHPKTGGKEAVENALKILSKKKE